MPDPTPRLYEGLFLVSQAAASAGTESCMDTLNGLFSRIDAEVVALRKWEDRKLAYTIEGQKRGTYLIAHFKVTPTNLINLERDCNLADDILRVMFTRCDHFGETELNAVINDLEVAETAQALEGDDGQAPAPAEPETANAE